MSRKKFCLDRSRDLFLEIQPTFHRPRWGRFCLLILISFSATGDDAIEFVRAASQQWLSVSTIYPRLVAYDYFWLSAGA